MLTGTAIAVPGSSVDFRRPPPECLAGGLGTTKPDQEVIRPQLSLIKEYPSGV
jgi:hypothetical protein